jgi:aminoglycoside phosphotransferase (APT) family kinase protein
MDDSAEYTTLQYLEKFVPRVPAPRPLGLVRFGECVLLFISLMPGTTLETAWHELDSSLKRSVQEQLNDIFVELRSLTRPDDMPLGGVAGEGCKDLKRNVRRTAQPMWTTEAFDDWQFSNPHFGSSIYIETLRRLSPPLPQKHVLCHNDLRPDNVMVDVEGGRCRVTGIIDWEYGCFYPEYYESTKVMNGISPIEESDWYLFVPESISPLRNAQKWLLEVVA